MSKNIVIQDKEVGQGTLNYKGDQREALGRIVGPGQDGRMFVIVDIEYDTEQDRSCVVLNELDLTPKIPRR